MRNFVNNVYYLIAMRYRVNYHDNTRTYHTQHTHRDTQSLRCSLCLMSVYEKHISPKISFMRASQPANHPTHNTNGLLNMNHNLKMCFNVIKFIRNLAVLSLLLLVYRGVNERRKKNGLNEITVHCQNMAYSHFLIEYTDIDMVRALCIYRDIVFFPLPSCSLSRFVFFNFPEIRL